MHVVYLHYQNITHLCEHINEHIIIALFIITVFYYYYSRILRISLSLIADLWAARPSIILYTKGKTAAKVD